MVRKPLDSLGWFPEVSTVLHLPAAFSSETGTNTFDGHSRLVVPPLPAKYFADAAVADTELPGDVTRSDPLVGELHDPLANNIWEGAAIHKNTPQLIHASMS